MANDDFQDILIFSSSGDKEEKPLESINKDDHKVYGDADEEFDSDSMQSDDFIVKVNRNNDVIQSFDIGCSCGKKIRIVIDYDSQE